MASQTYTREPNFPRGLGKVGIQRVPCTSSTSFALVTVKNSNIKLDYGSATPTGDCLHSEEPGSSSIPYVTAKQIN